MRRDPLVGWGYTVNAALRPGDPINVRLRFYQNPGSTALVRNSASCPERTSTGARRASRTSPFRTRRATARSGIAPRAEACSRSARRTTGRTTRCTCRRSHRERQRAHPAEPRVLAQRERRQRFDNAEHAYIYEYRGHFQPYITGAVRSAGRAALRRAAQRQHLRAAQRPHLARLPHRFTATALTRQRR